MSELTTASSFIIRIYRVDTSDPRGITGLLETTDGSGERHPFTTNNELTAILIKMTAKQRREKKRNRSNMSG